MKDEREPKHREADESGGAPKVRAKRPRKVAARAADRDVSGGTPDGVSDEAAEAAAAAGVPDEAAEVAATGPAGAVADRSPSDSPESQPTESVPESAEEAAAQGGSGSDVRSQSAAVLDAFFASPTAAAADAVLEERMAPPGFRTGYVALVGRPNVGKSTLMNRFLDERIAIVTAKPQTTRRKTLGILNTDHYQVVLLDTPGIMEPKYALHKAMLHEAMSALDDADVVVFLVDASRPTEILPSIVKIRAPRLLALNKVDRVTKKSELIPILDGYGQSGLFDEIFPISALRGDGVDGLLEGILARIPEGPPFYPPEQISEQPERFFVAELVREWIFRLYEQEVPYSTEVIVTQFDERPRGKDFVEATIFVETDSQKAILIGKKGLAIKELGEAARAAIEEFLGRAVFLSLKVKTMPKWRKKADSLRKLGYKG